MADRRRLLAIRNRLRKAYGHPEPRPHHAPVDELVLTVLSQNTNDRNRDVAYHRLRARFPDWEAARAAGPEAIEDAIRPGGLAPTKSVRILRILDSLDGDDLSWLAGASVEEGRDFLTALPGVGRKTAACVLLFSYGLHDVPVDTHVHRVGVRLGLFGEKDSLEACHDELNRLTGPDDGFEVHMALIRHGRRTCSARAPRCPECPLLSLCPFGRART